MVFSIKHDLMWDCYYWPRYSKHRYLPSKINIHKKNIISRRSLYFGFKILLSFENSFYKRPYELLNEYCPNEKIHLGIHQAKISPVKRLQAYS